MHDDTEPHTVTSLRLPQQRPRWMRAVAAPGVAGIAVFALAVTIAVVMALMQPHEAAEQTVAADEILAVSEPTREDAGEAAEGPESTELYVHIVGEVQNPGVVRVTAGSRVADALEAAGGATDAAVLSGVNLARSVVDGEQILVPNAEQIASGTAQEVAEAPASGGESGAVSGGSMVNLNTADRPALETLPRVGPALAQRIIDWREANGGFSSVDQLLDVSGIGEKTLAGFRELVTV